MTYPHRRFLSAPLLLLPALLLAAACGETHPAGDAAIADGGFVHDAAVTPLDAGESRVDAGPPFSACVDLCARRESDPTSGGCPFDTIPESGDCATRCEAERGSSAATREAFEWCVLNDPLCFQSIDQCVYTRLYPDPIPMTTSVSAEGLEAFPGLNVTVAIRVGDTLLTRETTVAFGRFEVRFDDALPAAWPPSAFGYVDVDGDGRCDGESDVTFYESLERVGTFDEPAYAVHLMGPPDRALGFVCDEL